MRVLRNIPDLRAALVDARHAGLTIGLVPTMGAFHEGHLSLIRRARAEREIVVVSLFVNPKQFNDLADLDTYPRDERRDAALAEEIGPDFLFAPPTGELYPDGFATQVTVSGATETLEGAHRGAGHFAGVATVVAKLLNIVAPSVAYFGQKDAQQTVLIKRLVRDLDIPVRIEVSPTVRAHDGLALSSRNARLSARDRERATALYRSLLAAERAIVLGQHQSEAVLTVARQELALEGIEPEYLALVDPGTFAILERLEGEVLAVVAASFGGIRLIDNLPIRVPAAPAPNHGETIKTGTATLLASP